MPDNGLDKRAPHPESTERSWLFCFGGGGGGRLFTSEPDRERRRFLPHQRPPPGLCKRYRNLRPAETKKDEVEVTVNIEGKKSNPLSVVPGTMAPWLDFDAIFSFNKNVVYDGKVIEQIISNRRALENQLFADRLLGLLGVKAGKQAF